MSDAAGTLSEQVKQHASGSAFSWIETLLKDVRFGLRMLRKNPGFTTVAILTLALGTGATTAIFTVVDKVLLQPYAAPDPDHVVVLTETYEDGRNSVISIPKFMQWRDQPRVLEQAALYGFPGGLRVNLMGGDQPEQLRATQVSANFFSLFGIRLVRGRTFSVEEDSP